MDRFLKHIFAYFFIFTLISPVFYLNFSHFYSLIFTLDPDNFDILGYLKVLSDDLIIILSVGFLVVYFLIVLFLINWEIIKKTVIFTNHTYPRSLFCRSPPLN
jgi:hypothetical protein